MRTLPRGSARETILPVHNRVAPCRAARAGSPEGRKPVEHGGGFSGYDEEEGEEGERGAPPSSSFVRHQSNSSLANGDDGASRSFTRRRSERKRASHPQPALCCSRHSLLTHDRWR
eukprot:1413339-Prymnesium_polylepis.1